MNRFSNAQKRFLWGCVIAYTVAYLNRLNLSAALGGIGANLGLEEAQLGLLQTAFALVYATGQLINGAIADRVPPYRHLLLGVAGYSLTNLLMGFATNYGMLMALCVFNGAFQSMLWTPIVRMVAHFYRTPAQREKANMALSLTMVLGHLGAWGISGYLSEQLSWRYSFRIPGLVGFAALALCFFLLRDSRVIGGEKQSKAGKQQANGLWQVLARSGFFYLLACCILYGFVRDGIVTWAPQKLNELGGGQGVLSSLLIPCINALGVLGGYAFKRYGAGNNRRCVAAMLLLTTLFCLPLPMLRHAFAMAAFMGLGCACLYGSNPLLTALVPLEHDRIGRVSLTAGLIDSAIYLGSALAGGLGGAITQALGAGALYTSWIICMLLAASLAFVSGSAKRLRVLEGSASSNGSESAC